MVAEPSRPGGIALSAEELAGLAAVAKIFSGADAFPVPILYAAPQVASILLVEPRTFNRMVADGTFPDADIRRGRKFVRWRLQTVLRGIDELASKSPS